jgi:hypothetical protein
VRLWPIGLQLVFLVALAPACGGAAGSDSLSASEFRDQAEAICRDVEETDVPPPSDFTDVDRYVDEFTGVIDRSVSDFHELNPPEEFRARWQEYLKLIDQAASILHQAGEDLEGATPAEAAELADEVGVTIEGLAVRGHAIERELGLDECVT